jgi:hypothetical protein
MSLRLIDGRFRGYCPGPDNYKCCVDGDHIRLSLLVLMQRYFRQRWVMLLLSHGRTKEKRY